MSLPGRLGLWTQGDWVTGPVGVTAARAGGLVGDAGFVGHDDWGLVELAWDDRELFGYIYAGSAPAPAFEALEDYRVWRRNWVHRRARCRASDLRQAWAEELRSVWGLEKCGNGDGRWVRTIAGEMLALVATDPSYASWATAGRPRMATDGEPARLARGRQVSAKVEAKYRTLVEKRRVRSHLLKVGVPPTNLSNGRKAFVRELGLVWPWAVGLRTSPEGVSQLISLRSPPGNRRLGSNPGLIVDVPALAEMPAGGKPLMKPVEVAGPIQVRRLDVALGGAGRLAVLARELSAVLVGFGSGNSGAAAARALGFVPGGGHVSGCLTSDWAAHLAVELKRSVPPGDGATPLTARMEALRIIGPSMLAAAGLVDDGAVLWSPEGYGCNFSLRDRARSAGRARLILQEQMRNGHLGRSGKERSGSLQAPVLISVGKSPQGRTVYRDLLRARLTPEDRGFWDGIEKTGGCVAAEALSGGQRLITLYDGLAAAYLASLGLGEEAGAEGEFFAFWNGHAEDEAVSVKALTLLREALAAAQVWALRQILEHGHEWLGLSTAYRRSLALAYRRLEGLLVEFPTSGEWVVDRLGVAGLEVKPTDATARIAALAARVDMVAHRLRAEDRFFSQASTAPWHLTAGGPAFPTAPPPRWGSRLWWLFGPRGPQAYLTGGTFYRDPSLRWVNRNVVGGAVLPGLVTEQDARSVGHIFGLSIAGLQRHRRALLVAYAAGQNGGKVPDRFLPWIPLGIGDPLKYVGVVESTGGATLGDVCFLGAVHGSESKPVQELAAALAKPWTWGKLREHWQFVGAYPSLSRLQDPFGLVRLVSRVRQHLAHGLNPLTLEPLSVATTSKQIWANLVR